MSDDKRPWATLEDLFGPTIELPEWQLPRERATKIEMEKRARFLIRYAERHGPVTVRQLYYQAEVAGLPGIEKTEAGYLKVQRQVLDLRREGRLPYEDIADATRWMRKPRTYADIEEFLNSSQALYRKTLWRDVDALVEVWCEKDALAGVIDPITVEYDVALMVTRGFASETFCYEAIAQRGNDMRPYHVYYLGDFDRAGHDAARSLEEKLFRFAAEKGIEVHFRQIAVTAPQIHNWNLPTRQPKRESAADKNWPYPFACELDAIPPDDIRQLVRDAIEQHLPTEELERLKVQEDRERETLATFFAGWPGYAAE